MKFLAVVAILFGVFCLSNAQCPAIVSRSEWGARPANTGALPIRPAPWYVIHHSAGAACTTRAACNTQMRQIQNQHIDGNGWADIGYNFAIGGDGAVYEGRGWAKQGAHAPGYNDKSHGICFLGTYTSSTPSTAMLNAAKALIACGVTNGQASSNYGLIGHRQAVATECPGTALYNEIRTWPNYRPNP